MSRIIAIIAMFALALPSLAAAAEERHGGPPPGRAAAPRGPAPGPRVAPAGPRAVPGPRVVPGGARVVPGGPRVGPGGGQLSFRGHSFNRVHAAPFVYPGGYGYRRWGAGMILPGLFLAPLYYYSGWADLGLPPPDPGFQWVRYGPDLLLVNVATGQVVDTIYDAFY